MYKHLRWTMIAVLFLVVACQPAEPTPVSISTFTDADPELMKAVRQAQDTMYIFRRAFLSPKPNYQFMSVKVRFESRQGTEDMWTEPIEIIDNTFLVRMIEGVALELKAHPDRYVEVRDEDVIDWMILQTDGTVQGGYTLRIFYDSLSPEEQEQYRQNTGYLRFE